MPRIRYRARFALIMVVVLTASCLGEHSFAQRYEVVDLGALRPPGALTLVDGESAAKGIASAGRYAAGQSMDQAVLWDDGVIINLGQGLPTRAEAVNNAGDAVGSTEVRSIPLLYKAGEQIELGVLPTYEIGWASDINDSTQIVGTCTDDGGFARYQAFLWEDSILTALEGFGLRDSYAYGINSLGVVVGSSKTEPTPHFTHAVKWDGAVITDLGTIADCNESKALAINDLGEIVGFSNACTPNGQHAFLWANGVLDRLPDLGPDYWSVAYDINNQGVIVGTSSNQGANRACVWIDGIITDLNDYVGGTGWTLEYAFGISDDGLIVGWGNNGGTKRAYMLVSAPELTVGPLVGGQPGTFAVTEATPDTMQYLAYSINGYGHTPVPTLNVILNLHRPKLGAKGLSTAGGGIEWILPIPAIASGQTLYFQAAEFGHTTNVVMSLVQ